MQVNISDLKSRLNRDDIVSILTGYGYVISTKDYKFCLRDEKTPSAVINKDGSVFDFGTDIRRDIFDILQEFHNMTLANAIKAVAEHISYSESTIVPYKPSIEPKKEYVSVLSEERYKKILKTLEWYDSQKQLQTFKNQDYKIEALSICPLWVFQQATSKAIELFKSLTTYDFKNKTLVIKIHDYQEKLISYKRRRFNAGKWVTAKDTHPNKQCLESIKSKDNLIYIVEGHHDFLTAVLLDLDVLMIPTVSYKSFNEYEVSLLKNRDVIFIPDYAIKNDKEDLTGVECMRKLALQIDSVVRNTKIFSLVKFLENENITFTGNKLDLSEVVELWSSTLEAFTNTLAYRADRGIFYNAKELF